MEIRFGLETDSEGEGAQYDQQGIEVNGTDNRNAPRELEPGIDGGWVLLLEEGQSSNPTIPSLTSWEAGMGAATKPENVELRGRMEHRADVWIGDRELFRGQTLP